MTRRSKSAGVTLVQVSFTWHVKGGACANLEEARRWPFHVGHLLATAGFFAYITAPGSGPPRSPARSMQKEMRAPWLLAITRVATSLPKVAIAHLYLRSDHSAPRHFLLDFTDLRIYRLITCPARSASGAPKITGKHQINESLTSSSAG